uniref:Uncharacterized protein n=1 Tax=Coccidioides posadasii RMSCC 3488 TaxID=454284 RepID=A0A0J6F5V8_COCPO|nr:hypothetical protein CPAG_00691 [Coccidioides posadasii RMSCC 3488]
MSLRAPREYVPENFSAFLLHVANCSTHSPLYVTFEENESFYFVPATEYWIYFVTSHVASKDWSTRNYSRLPGSKLACSCVNAYVHIRPVHTHNVGAYIRSTLLLRVHKATLGGEAGTSQVPVAEISRETFWQLHLWALSRQRSMDFDSYLNGPRYRLNEREGPQKWRNRFNGPAIST